VEEEFVAPVVTDKPKTFVFDDSFNRSLRHSVLPVGRVLESTLVCNRCARAIRSSHMSTEKPLKSALELAMERLRKADAAAGVEPQPLTESKKTAIAEVRNFYEAKLAEQDVLHYSKLRRVMDPAEREALEQGYRRERERLTSERDAKIEKLRRA